MNVKFFENIMISPPPRMIYTRLGYLKEKTKLKSEQKNKIDQYIEEASTFIKIKGVALRVSISKIESPKIMLKDGIDFQSVSLSELLADCEEVLFMGATAGSEIAKVIKNDSAGKDMMRAVVFDAVASEMTDKSLNWIMNYTNRELRRENKHLTRRRFSAGYGDFLLDNQKIIYNILKMKQIGVNLTKSYMLIPEKSVTAVAGINFIR